MAFGSQKAAVGLILLATVASAAEMRFHVRHDHWRGSAPGVLIADETGLTYEERGDHSRKWPWHDVQELRIEPRRVTVLTYSDNPWKLGADRSLRFDLSGESAFESLYQLAKDRLDSRLVAVFAQAPAQALWQLPVKLRRGFSGGSEGELIVTADEIVYSSPEKGESRTWRLADIDNISSSGPYDFTVTTAGRSYNFQLKQRLDERNYNTLWRRMNQTLQEKQ